MAAFDDFMKLDIRVGTITEAKTFEKARRPAYQLWVDLGEEIGVKKPPLRSRTTTSRKTSSASRCWPW